MSRKNRGSFSSVFSVDLEIQQSLQSEVFFFEMCDDDVETSDEKKIVIGDHINDRRRFLQNIGLATTEAEQGLEVLMV